MENVELPLLPYNGTSGWSGSETSKERAENADASGETSENQAFTLKALKTVGDDGMTWQELSALTGWHHGKSSGALSNLHKGRQIQRLKQRRGGCQIYVSNDYVNGRELAPYKPNAANDQIAELRQALAEAHRLLDAANLRAERQAETIRKLMKP